MGGTPEDETLPASGSEPGRTEGSRALEIGSQAAGRYRISRFLGAGGMGEVYAADDLILGAPVAIKTLKPELEKSSIALERFRREISLARKVTNPHVCRLHDVGEHAGRVFLSMELLEGTTLAQRVRDDGPLPLDELERIATQLVKGLAALHAAGIVHRDFKTANVLLVDNRAVITDFGLARSVVDRDSGLTSESGLMGTPAYMAPEQVEGRTATPVSDIYALGVVLFELATGKLPFAEDTALATATARLQHDAPRASSIRKDLPARWDAIIARCLMREPADRFARVEDVLGLRAPLLSRRVLLGASAGLLAAGGLGAWRLLATRGGGPAASPNRIVAVLAVEGYGPLRQILKLDPWAMAFTIDLRESLATSKIPTIGLDVADMNDRVGGSAMLLLDEPDPTAAAMKLANVDVVVRMIVVERPDGPRGTLALAVTIEQRGRSRWRKTLSRPAAEVTLLVDDVARAIAAELGYPMPRRPLDAGNHDPAIYEQYGRALVRRIVTGGKPVPALMKVYRDHPALTRAGVRVFLWHAENVAGQSHDIPRRMDEILRRIAPVLEADPDHALALAVRGIASMVNYDWKTCETSIARAFELAPTHDRIAWYRGFTMMMQGRSEEARHVFLELFGRNPLSPGAIGCIPWTHYYTRRFADVIAHAPPVIDQLPAWARNITMTFIGLSYAHTAQFDQAIVWADKVREADDNYVSAGLAVIYALCGKRDTAIQLRDAMLADKKNPIAPILFAQIEDALGNIDAALEGVERNVDSHNLEVVWIKIEMFSPALRSHPRFQAALRKVGLADAPPGSVAATNGLVAVLPVEGAGELLDDGLRVALTVDLLDALGTASVRTLTLDTGVYHHFNFNGTAAKLGREKNPSAAARAIAGVAAVVRLAITKRPEAGGVLGVAVTIERDGQPAWTREVSRPATDATLLVDDVARVIAAELGYPSPTRPDDAQPYDATVYPAYGTALAALLRDRTDKSAQPLEEVVAKTPKLARAAARLAGELIADAWFGEEAGRTMKLIGQADKLLDGALAIDPDHPLALAFRVFAAMLSYNWDKANIAGRRAIDLAPTLRRARAHYGFSLMLQGRFDEAAELRTGRNAADPRSHEVFVAHVWNLYYRREYAEVIELATPKLGEVPLPIKHQLLTYLAMAHAELAQFDEALKVADQLDKGDPYDRGVLVQVYAMSGQLDKAVALRKEIGNTAGVGTGAMMDAALGDTEAALRALETAVEWHLPETLWLKIERYPAQLRAQPRFQALMKKVGFAQ